MSVGRKILEIREKQNLTQADFGRLFHVTRQTVSSWENEKSYPDLQTLINISERFEISLDQLLKEDSEMIKEIDRERLRGTFIKRQKSIVDFFTGAGTGIVISCLMSPDTMRRIIAICIGILMILIGWYKKASYDKAILNYVEEQERVD